MMSESATTLLRAPEESGGPLPGLDRNAVEALAASGPPWLGQRRLEAWRVYEETPMPTTKEEEWRYTDLSKTLRLDELRLLPREEREFAPEGAPAPLTGSMRSDRAAAGHVVELDGSVAHTDLGEEVAREGVVLASLARAVEVFPEILEAQLATEALPAGSGKFQALNAALWTDGILLFVPRGVHVELPIHLTRWFSEPGRAIFTRTLIVAEEGSRVSFVDEALSADFPAQTLVSSAVEVFARRGAHVQFVSLQRMGRGAFHISQQRTLADADAALDTLNVSFGASVARVDLNAELRGAGAHSDMLGLCFGEADQHFDHNTSQDHGAPHTRSDLLYKAALDEAARAVFRGVIRVHPGAQQTDAYQTNRNLILSPDARAESLPNLEIEADDVRCSHGATVGQLDEEHLFYLMSRGLTRAQAERLVVTGFLGEVLSRLPLGGVVEKVSGIIEERLRA